jgi:hypothetical protein
LLTGIGQRGSKGEHNDLIVNKETTDAILEEKMTQLLDRTDIGIILIA